MAKEQTVVFEGRGLTHKVGGRPILSNIDLRIYKGESFAVIGPYESGISTLLKMFYGRITPGYGELFALGLNIRNSSELVRQQMGIMPQKDFLDPEFSVLDNLIVFASHCGLSSRVGEENGRDLLRRSNLDSEADAPISDLSLLQRKKLGLIRAFISKPEVVVLDSPTEGLRYNEKVQIWRLAKQLTEQFGQGKATLILGTHSMEEAEILSERLCMLNKGRVIAQGTSAEIIEKNVGPDIVEFACDQAELDYYLSRLNQRIEYRIIKNKVRLFLKSSEEGRAVFDQIRSRDMTFRSATLEDAFLKISGVEI